MNSIYQSKMCEEFDTEEQKISVLETFRAITLLNQLGDYDVLMHHPVLCIIVGMMSLHIMHVSNCTVIDIMTFDIMKIRHMNSDNWSVRYFFFLIL
jgi:hypothetical protein